MKRRRQRLSTGILICALLASAGCDDPLEKAQIIASLRILGARVEVIDDPNRASPAPGERARVELFVASPEPAPALGWTLSACPIRPSNAGISRCASAPFATGASPLPMTGTPSFEFEVPNDLDSMSALTLAVQGKVCEGALAEGSGLSATCVSGASGTALSFEFPMATQGIANQNPSFAEIPVLLDASPWPPALDPCNASDAPSVTAKSGLHVIELAAIDAARESLPRRVPVEPPRETLQFSHFSDQVELERVFSSVPFDQSEARVRVEFQAPESAPNGGGLARFWFVLRDLRGGSAFIERSLCVVP